MGITRTNKDGSLVEPKEYTGGLVSLTCTKDYITIDLCKPGSFLKGLDLYDAMGGTAGYISLCQNVAHNPHLLIDLINLNPNADALYELGIGGVDPSKSKAERREVSKALAVVVGAKYFAYTIDKKTELDPYRAKDKGMAKRCAEAKEYKIGLAEADKIVGLLFKGLINDYHDRSRWLIKRYTNSDGGVATEVVEPFNVVRKPNGDYKLVGWEMDVDSRVNLTTITGEILTRLGVKYTYTKEIVGAFKQRVNTRSSLVCMVEQLPPPKGYVDFEGEKIPFDINKAAEAIWGIKDPWVNTIVNYWYKSLWFKANNPAHHWPYAILLIGPEGVGKTSVIKAPFMPHLQHTMTLQNPEHKEFPKFGKGKVLDLRDEADRLAAFSHQYRASENPLGGVLKDRISGGVDENRPLYYEDVEKVYMPQIALTTNQRKVPNEGTNRRILTINLFDYFEVDSDERLSPEGLIEGQRRAKFAEAAANEVWAQVREACKGLEGVPSFTKEELAAQLDINQSLKVTDTLDDYLDALHSMALKVTEKGGRVRVHPETLRLQLKAKDVKANNQTLGLKLTKLGWERKRSNGGPRMFAFGDTGEYYTLGASEISNCFHFEGKDQ